MKLAIVIVSLIMVALGLETSLLEEKLEKLNNKLLSLEEDNKVLKFTLEKIEKEELVGLKSKIQDLTNPPFFHSCLYQDEYHTAGSPVIDYDKIMYLSSNRCEDADIDLNSGVFTAGWPGTYTVTVDLMFYEFESNLYFRKNGAKIEESFLSSYNVYDFDQGKNNFTTFILNFIKGGRTILLHLDTGDQIDIYCENCSSRIYFDITLCISLSTYDVVEP